MGRKALYNRIDDLARQFARLARRYELQAQAVLAQGHEKTAAVDFFSTSAMYGAAQRPIVSNTTPRTSPERAEG